MKGLFQFSAPIFMIMTTVIFIVTDGRAEGL